MIITSARFSTSSPSVDKCPGGEPRHEYAFIGRSNVGKSSLINMLTGQKGLAMTSSTPGKTMLINYFLIHDSFMQWLGENGIPFSIVFTKLDKLSSLAVKKAIAAYCDLLRESWEELPPIFATSSEDGRGRVALLDYIEELNRLPL